ncbi:MAG: hypothetical protein KR126chlam4_00417 [Candidatus Anoxychlamydiales bacterium]|uniref:Uncharacterized protein n=1 Tax=marine sediment metagenome TaxID=412755 RepID=A0A0F9LCU8_9ZZZZ|nr:hypothetical protein [Candidatus Anoxychlamydiales bacterium]NGX40594.1 hypothetical protein [Candidatus Anoxychlamydiales bacterium]HEU64276.1 hypothetical protein [Chlamydiota bacterium]
MKRITKLEELAGAIERIKNQKKVDSKAINNLKHELDEEEKISRNYLQITQNGIFAKNIKKALRWNKKVIDLKHELYAFLK